MSELTLSDGIREIDLMGASPDGIYLVEFAPPIVERENTYAEGADSEGRQRVRSRGQNATGSGRLRIDRSQDTAAEFWDEVDDLQDLVESAHARKGTLRYVPPAGEAVTFDLQSIRLSNVPQNGPSLTVRRVEPEFEFECLPYGRLDAVTLETAEVITGPLDSFEVVIPGHVDAWAELTLTDTSTQAADHLEVGVDLNPTASAEMFGITTLVTSGFAGASATRAGSYNANVIRATLTTSPVTLCGTAAPLHVGRKKIRTRVYASLDVIYVRLAYRVGDGPFKLCPWRRVPYYGAWFDVALDVIDIAEVPSGTHSWEGRIQAYAETPGTTLDLDLLEVFPADVYAKVGVPQLIAMPTAFSARDEFDQTAGALTGKVAPVGGTWAALTLSDTTDFNVSGAGLITRTAVSDTGTLFGATTRGRVVGLNLNLTATAATLDFKASAHVPTVSHGLFTRVVDNANLLEVRLVHYTSAGVVQILVAKVIAGVYADLAVLYESLDVTALHTLVVTVVGTTVYVFIDGRLVITVVEATLATTLASGDVYIYDGNSVATACTRTYDNFAVWVPEVDHALMSGQSAKFQHNAFIRENSAGTRYGKLPIEGQHLRIPPSTRSDLPRRVVVKRRRLNNDAGQPDLGLTDNATVDLSVQPRVALLGA